MVDVFISYSRTDLAAVAENKIAVTPLNLDLTDRSAAETLAARLA